LYEAGLREADAVKLLGDRVGAPEIEPISDYTISLVEGVSGHRARIDELLSAHAQGWRLARMPAVDLAVLRVGLHEMPWAWSAPGGWVREPVGSGRSGCGGDRRARGHCAQEVHR